MKRFDRRLATICGALVISSVIFSAPFWYVQLPHKIPLIPVAHDAIGQRMAARQRTRIIPTSRKSIAAM